MDLRAFGSHSRFIWNHEYLVKVVTGGKRPLLDDPILINAFSSIKREHFTPEKLREFAYEDREIDIGYKEKMTRPTVVALMLKLLEPTVGGSYLDLGSGSGYFATILAKAIGNTGRVYSLERVQWLWEMCRRNLKHYPEIENLQFLYRDGIEGLPDKAPYNGIHASFNYGGLKDLSVIERLKTQLKVGNGILVYPINEDIQVIKRTHLDKYEEELVSGHLFDEVKEGLA